LNGKKVGKNAIVIFIRAMEKGKVKKGEKIHITSDNGINIKIF